MLITTSSWLLRTMTTTAFQRPVPEIVAHVSFQGYYPTLLFRCAKRVTRESRAYWTKQEYRKNRTRDRLARAGGGAAGAALIRLPSILYAGQGNVDHEKLPAHARQPRPQRKTGARRRPNLRVRRGR
jgi:hypothetical protein